MDSKTIQDSVQIKGKSNGFVDDVETLLEDMANPVNDLENMTRLESFSASEQKVVNDWLVRIQAIRDEMTLWGDIYLDKLSEEE